MYARNYLFDVPKALTRKEQNFVINSEADKLKRQTGQYANTRPSVSFVFETEDSLVFEYKTLGDSEVRSLDAETMERIGLVRAGLGKNNSNSTREGAKELANETSEVDKKPKPTSKSK